VTRRYRVAVVGFAHMHVNHLMSVFSATNRVDWIACADTIPDVPELVEAPDTRAWNLRQAREAIGVPKVYTDYREMLDKERFDLVLVCSENGRHAEVAEAVAAKGASLIVEKPMAAGLADALRITRAAQAAGVELFVNWPTTWIPTFRKVKQLVDEGAIGEVWEVKMRGGSLGPLSHNAHGSAGTTAALTGAQKGATWWHRAGTGGGAMLDYCGYGAYLSRWYLGEGAEAAFGMKANLRSHYASSEDNAAVLVRFPRAMAILEATWSCLDHGAPWLLVYGDTGTLAVYPFDPRQLVTITRGPGTEPQEVEAEPLPVGRENIAGEIIHHLDTGEPVHETLQPGFNLEAMAILDAGIRSAASGKLELVDDVTWRAGY